MYNSDLEPRRLSVDHLYLDPNNPRFAKRKGVTPSAKFTDAAVQETAMSTIFPEGVPELARSILRNGFLPLDRIVVREIPEASGSFVVVEGNRRLCALRTLAAWIDGDEIDADDLSESYLTSLRDSIREIEVLVYTGTESDVAWILQGVRHLSGIKDWSPAQKAELVVKEIKERGLGFRAVGETLGMSAQQVGRYYRAHCALQQMKEHPDFGDRFDKQLFTLFDEAYSKRPIREWLEWSDNDEKFTEAANLEMFYSWITEDPAHEGQRRVHDPRQMRILSRLVQLGRDDLIHKVDEYQMTLEQADASINSEDHAVDWRDALTKAQAAINQIPLVAIEEPDGQLVEGLEGLVASLTHLLGILGSSASSSG